MKIRASRNHSMRSAIAQLVAVAFISALLITGIVETFFPDQRPINTSYAVATK